MLWKKSKDNVIEEGWCGVRETNLSFFHFLSDWVPPLSMFNIYMICICIIFLGCKINWNTSVLLGGAVGIRSPHSWLMNRKLCPAHYHCPLKYSYVCMRTVVEWPAFAVRLCDVIIHMFLAYVCQDQQLRDNNKASKAGTSVSVYGGPGGHMSCQWMSRTQNSPSSAPYSSEDHVSPTCHLNVGR